MTVPLRLGVIGCGRVFEKFHLPAIGRVSEVQLAAASDPDASRLASVDRYTPTPRLFPSAAAMIDAGGMDAVLVLTPPPTHAAIVVQSLEAGLHVLVEKPMALDVAEGRRMVGAAREAHRRLQVGFTRRFREPYRWLRRLLEEVGSASIESARFDLSFSTTDWAAHSAFAGDDRQGGGPLDDVFSHQVDLLGWLLGPAEAVRAQAGPGHTVQAEIRIGPVNLRCRASHGHYQEHLELFLRDGRSLQASGTKASAGRSKSRWWAVKKAWLGDRLQLAGDRLLGRPNPTLLSFERQLRDFQAAVRGLPADGATGVDGLRTIGVIQACRASLSAGGTWQRVGPAD
jgi:predicted dehydrogenase